MGSLSANGKGLSVAKTSVGADIHQPLDIHGHLSPEVPFYFILPVDGLPDLHDIRLGELAHFCIHTHLSFLQDFTRYRPANTIDICQRNLDPFTPWQINARYSCQLDPPLSLASACALDYCI